MSRWDFASYDDYLRSSEWKELRASAITSAGGKCALCEQTENLQAHHRNYRNIDEPNLVCLCADCHAKLHRILAKVKQEIPARDMIMSCEDDVRQYRDDRIARIFAAAINKEWPNGIKVNKNHFSSQIKGLYIDFYDSYNVGPFLYYDNGYTIVKESVLPYAEKISQFLIKIKRPRFRW